MPDLIETFRQKAEDLINSLDRKGGVRATLESLRRQMAEADRRRAVNKVKAELGRLEAQINEMVTAVGVQAVGLHEAGRLTAPELQPLCQHILELKAALAQQQAELAKLEATIPDGSAAQANLCASCGKPLPAGATFCPYCGAPVQAHPERRFCMHCGSELRPESKFCMKCGQPVKGSP